MSEVESGGSIPRRAPALRGLVTSVIDGAPVTWWPYAAEHKSGTP